MRMNPKVLARVGMVLPAIALTMALGCGSDSDAEPEAPRPEIELSALPYEHLSDYGFFVGEMVDGDPAPGVIPFTVAAPLWADAAGKGRYMFLPEGQQAIVTETDEWTFPVGTILIKSFFVDIDRSSPADELVTIETRLLVHQEEDQWHSYI